MTNEHTKARNTTLYLLGAIGAGLYTGYCEGKGLPTHPSISNIVLTAPTLVGMGIGAHRGISQEGNLGDKVIETTCQITSGGIAGASYTLLGFVMGYFLANHLR